MTFPSTAPLIRTRSVGVLGTTLVLVGALLFAGCGGGSPPPSVPAPMAGAAVPEAPAPKLPDLERVEGPLDLRVSYPRADARVATDTTFIFGSTGNRRARLTIDGTPVAVESNGAFLAFLPVPRDGTYDLEATLDGTRRTLQVPVSVPAGRPPPVHPLIVPASVYPSGAWLAAPDEPVEVGFRGSAGGSAALVFTDGTRVPLVEISDGSAGVTDFRVANAGDPDAGVTATAPDLATYRGVFAARPLAASDTTVPWPSLAEPRGQMPLPERGGAWVELSAAGSQARQPLRLNLRLTDPDRPRVGRALDPRAPEANGDRAINARPGPGGGPYQYTWINGTEFEISGERNGTYRVPLTDELDVWTPAFGVEWLPSGTAPPASRATSIRMAPGPEWIDVHVALDRSLPYQVVEGPTSLTLQIFGAVSQVNFLQHGGLDPWVLAAVWRQPSNRLFEVEVQLAGAPWGWEIVDAAGDDRVLRIRRPPELHADAPLRGLLIGIDPGHGGEDRETMGPTGLTEADANLAIALMLREELEARGARTVLTRTTDTTVSLVERTDLARAQNVDLWVSVHNNAFPDGVDPWANNGTSVYYNHPKAAPLARAVQRELIRELGLRDLGVGSADLHQARFSWAPAILIETAFLMIPRQEALLRSEEGQRRIARAEARGIEAWLKERATGGDSRSRWREGSR